VSRDVDQLLRFFPRCTEVHGKRSVIGRNLAVSVAVQLPGSQARPSKPEKMGIVYR